jgi:CRISPR type IV-associated protein Csf3
MFFKVVFHLDGSGLIYDPTEPINLDSLLSYCLAPIHCQNTNIGRMDEPEYIPLPLMKHTFEDGAWVWQASALFPEGPISESMQHWRKKFRQNRIEYADGSLNLMSGIYREYNVPIPLTHCLKMIAYANGNASETKRILEKNIKFLGKKRAYGKGAVVGITTEEMSGNCSLVKNGLAMRWLPSKSGSRLVRLQPPYWNNVNRVVCCEIGDRCGDL